MGRRDTLNQHDAALSVNENELEELLGKSTQHSRSQTGRDGIAIGELLAILDGGRTPLVSLPFESGAGLRARTTIDLHGDDIGQQLVVIFEGSDPKQPIVIGVLRTDRTTAPSELFGKVDISADGERMIVSARRELVLRCGKASITLKHDGTVQIVGEKLLSRAKGANRVQGGSVHLN